MKNLPHYHSVLTLAAFLFTSSCSMNPELAEIHVSPSGSDSNLGTAEAPLRTLPAAKNRVRQLSSRKGATVILHDGIYTLSEPLIFTGEDSGEKDAPVTWRAADNAEPIISGAVRVTGWTPHENGIWKASLARNVKLRQLYVGDIPADMAAYGPPLVAQRWEGEIKITGKESWAGQVGKVKKAMVFESESLPRVARPEDLEMQQRRTWTTLRAEVETLEYTPNADLLVLKTAVSAIGQSLGWNCGFSLKNWKECYLFNALEFLDEPGEFYFNPESETVYYMPRSGQDMNTAIVMAPVVSKLIQIQGDHLNSRAHDLAFEGITFAHTEWRMMKIGNGYGSLPIQSSAMSVIFKRDGNWHKPPYGVYTCTDLPASAVELNKAERISFRRNRFTALGCMALNAENACDEIEIIGNIFSQLEGAGINIGHPHHTYIGKMNGENNGFGPYDIDNSKDKWSEESEALVCNVKIRNNLFRDTSTVWWGMSPITVYYGHSIYIEHNDLLDIPYNPISIGWSWGEFNGTQGEGKANYHPTLGGNSGKPSLSVNDIKVNYNRVVHPYMLLTDAGGLYFLGDCAAQIKGQMPTYSEVRGNYLVEHPERVASEVISKSGSLIYTDEGTSYLNFLNNVVDGEIGVWRIFQRGRGSTNKHYENNYFAHYADFRTKTEPNTMTILDLETSEVNNAYMIKKRGAPPLSRDDWQESALEIIDNAGLEPEYQDLFEN